MHCKMKARKKKKKPSMYMGGGKIKKASMYENGGSVPKKMKKKVAKKVGPSQVKNDGSKANYAVTGNNPFRSNKVRSETRGKQYNAGDKKRLTESLLTPKDQAPPKMKRLGLKYVGSNKNDNYSFRRKLKTNPKALKPSGPSVAAMKKKKPSA